MNFISKEALQRIREEFTEGTRVELTGMRDPYRTDLVPGCKGTVRSQGVALQQPIPPCDLAMQP